MASSETRLEESIYCIRISASLRSVGPSPSVRMGRSRLWPVGLRIYLCLGWSQPTLSFLTQALRSLLSTFFA